MMMNSIKGAMVAKQTAKSIAILSIAYLLCGIAKSVAAQPLIKTTPQLIAQLNNGLPNHLDGGINSGRFTNPSTGNFYRGYLNNQGGLYQGSLYRGSSIYQGTFYQPNSGGNFHGLFYDPGSGRIIQGNFYNPGTGNIDQSVYYNPIPPGSGYPANSYNLGIRCSDERSLHDWGLGCFGQRDYKKAIEYYSQEIRRNPQQAGAYNQRALARFILGDRQGTIADLRKAASLYLAQGDQKRYQQTLLTITDVQSQRPSSTKKQW